jgi:Domain of unknown function (DUF222)
LWSDFKSVAHWLAWACSMTPRGRAGTRPGCQGAAPHAQSLADRPNVPAGTATTPGSPQQAVCHIAGVVPIEVETARRLACDTTLLGAIIDARGEVLTLGRRRRLVTRAQRRALMIRDTMCQFPGCHQTRYLEAHHRIPWAEDGRTDLDKSRLPYAYHMTYGVRRQDCDGARVLAGIDGSLRSATQH